LDRHFLFSCNHDGSSFSDPVEAIIIFEYQNDLKTTLDIFITEGLLVLQLLSNVQKLLIMDIDEVAFLDFFFESSDIVRGADREVKDVTGGKSHLYVIAVQLLYLLDFDQEL